MLRLALQQIRNRPASFVAVAATAFLATGAITMFASLIVADVSTPMHLKADSPSADSLGTIAGVFGEAAMIVTLFVMVNSIGFAVRQQLGELALLRTIAATPSQIHRMVRWQAAAIVAAVAPLGWIAGSAGATWFLDALKAHDYAAPAIEIAGSPLPYVIAAGATLLIAAAASAFGVRRVTRLSPSAAMSDTSTERRGIGWLRWVLGILSLLDVAALMVVNMIEGGPEGADAALLVMLMLLVGVGFLGPAAARVMAAAVGKLPRDRAPRIGWLADANIRGYTHRLSSAVIPLALLVGVACTFLFIGPTMDHAATDQARKQLGSLADDNENWLRLVELGMFVLFAAVAIVNTLVALTLERRREFRLLALLGATRRDIWRMLVVESALVTAVGVALGTFIGALTLVTFSQGATGSPLPSVPMATYAVIVAATAALAAPSILIAGRHVLTRRDNALAGARARRRAGYDAVAS